MATALFLALVFCSALFLIVMYTGKRPDVPWSRLLLNGPLVVVHPERYFVDRVAGRVPWMVLTWGALLVLTAIAASIGTYS